MVPGTFPVREQIILQAIFDEGKRGKGGIAFAPVGKGCANADFHLSTRDERRGAQADNFILVQQAEAKTSVEEITGGGPGVGDLLADRLADTIDQWLVDVEDVKT